MDKTQRAEKIKQIESEAKDELKRVFSASAESETRCGKKRLVHVPPAVPAKFFRIIKWLFLFVAFGMLLAQFIFDVPAAVGTIGVLMLVVWVSLLRK